MKTPLSQLLTAMLLAFVWCSPAQAIDAARRAGDRLLLGQHVARASYFRCLRSEYRAGCEAAREGMDLALEVGDGFPGRLRTRLVPDDTAGSLVGFVQEAVEVGSTVITDGWTSYLALLLTASLYGHEPAGDGRADW